MRNCPYKEPWILLLAYSVIRWIRENNEDNKFYTSHPRVESALQEIQTLMFNAYYKDGGFKPIGQCSKEELIEELNKRNK